MTADHTCQGLCLDRRVRPVIDLVAGEQVKQPSRYPIRENALYLLDVGGVTIHIITYDRVRPDATFLYRRRDRRRERALDIRGRIDDPVRGRQGSVVVDELAVLGQGQGQGIREGVIVTVGGHDRGRAVQRTRRAVRDLGLDRSRGVKDRVGTGADDR